jgi:hypothetical protein
MGAQTIAFVVLAISVLGIAAPLFPSFRRGVGACLTRMGLWTHRPPEWHSRAVHDLRLAEDLLDLLEARGTSERELLIHGNASFEIRWR